MIDFPNDPSLGDEFTADNSTWIWDGVAWTLLSATAPVDWSDIQNVPAAFPPAGHTHVEANITDLDKYTKAETDALIASVTTATQGVYRTRTQLSESSVPASLSTIYTRGYSLEGDGGAAVYRRVGTEPAHAGKVQSADGAWWNLVPINGEVTAGQFGVRGEFSQGDVTSLLKAAVDYCVGGFARVLHLPGGTMQVSDNVFTLGVGIERVAFRGSDTEATLIRLSANMPANTFIFDIQGGSTVDRVEWVTVANITFICQNREFTGNAVRINKAYHVDWIRCRIIGFVGYALYIDDYWDSNLEGLRVVGCGTMSPTDARAYEIQEGLAANSVIDTDLPAVFITLTSAGAGEQTSNNVNFLYPQFESSWNHQVYFDDKVRRFCFTQPKLHGNQGAVITGAQMSVGGAISCIVNGGVFAYGGDCDHVEFRARAVGQTLVPRGWKFLGVDFSFSQGAAIRIRDGSHIAIDCCSFGFVGANVSTVIIEDTVPAGGGDRNISITNPSFKSGEARPVIEVPVAVSTEMTNKSRVRLYNPNRAASELELDVDTPVSGQFIDADVLAPDSAGPSKVYSRIRTTLRTVAAATRSAEMLFQLPIAGVMTPMLRLQGNNKRVEIPDATVLLDGTWETPLSFGDRRFMWVDATGELRTKATAPTSDTDGTVIPT